ncbi:PIG-P [Scleroderma yunnanense]
MVGLTTQPTPPVSIPGHDEHRSRATEFYGFVAWTSTSLAFVIFVLWAVLPDEQLRYLDITWYPNREWAILLPAYSVMVVLLTYFTYFSLALVHTPAFSDASAFVDSQAHLAPSDALDPYLKHGDPNSTPEPHDIPIGVVNRVLYGPRRYRE